MPTRLTPAPGRHTCRNKDPKMGQMLKGRTMEETIIINHSKPWCHFCRCEHQSTDEALWAAVNVEGYKDEDNIPTPLLRTPVVGWPWQDARCMPSHYIIITSLYSCTGEGNKMENTKTKQASKKIMSWDISSLLKQTWRLCTWKQIIKKPPTMNILFPTSHP